MIVKYYIYTERNYLRLKVRCLIIFYKHLKSIQMDFNQPLDHATQDGLQFNGPSLDFLKETAKWAQFLSILGFVGIGFMVLLALFIGTLLSFLPGGEMMPFPPALFSVIYLLFALFYFFPILYLYRFASSMLKAIRLESQTDLQYSFSQLKAHYRFFGILTAVILGINVLFFLFALLLGGTAAMMN